MSDCVGSVSGPYVCVYQVWSLYVLLCGFCVWAVCLCVSGKVPLCLIVWVLCLGRMSVCIR